MSYFRYVALDLTPGERKKGWGAEEQRSGGAEERSKKRELIIFGYKAQEIPPKISFTPYHLTPSTYHLTPNTYHLPPNT